jgi:hypothetical protein
LHRRKNRGHVFYINRRMRPFGMTPHQPDIVVRDLKSLADRLRGRSGSSFCGLRPRGVGGDTDQVSRCLAARPACHDVVRRGRHTPGGSTFFFADIAHYLYAGDTALHMAAAAFRRPARNSWLHTELD